MSSESTRATVRIGPEACRLHEMIPALAGPVNPLLPRGWEERLARARRDYEAEARRRPVYGYCTGLGELYSVRREDCPRDWEERVVEEHSVQTGDPVNPRIVRLFLAVRLSQLLRLPAPVRPEVAARLARALEEDLIPVVHESGSVGASGDLSPTAEAVRCLYYGRGEAWLRGERMSCGEALERAGLGPLPLEPGEALFLLNNTAWSTSLCAAAALAAERLIGIATGLAARAVRLAGASREHYEQELLAAKNCPAGAEISRRILPHAAERPRALQAPYSIRCIPQLLGAVRRVVGMAIGLLGEEACASTENPALIRGRVVHGCNFHAVKVAMACSMLQAAQGYMSAWLERLAAQMLREEVTGLPKDLAGPESSVGAMIVHYTMAALSARARARAGLEPLLNTPTSGLQEDIVSMAPEAAHSALEQARAVARMLALLEIILDRAESLSREEGPITGLQEMALEGARRLIAGEVPWLAPP